VKSVFAYECREKFDLDRVFVQCRGEEESHSLDAKYGPALIEAWKEWGEHGE